MKYPRLLKITVNAVGAWWALMSGAISIPLALLAILLGGSAGLWFGILGYVGLWVLVIRTVIQNHQFAEGDNAESCFSIEGIGALIPPGVDEFTCQINVSSAKTADNVQVAIDSAQNRLPQALGIGPKLPLVLEPETERASTINPGATQRYNLFKLTRSKKINYSRYGDIQPSQNFFVYVNKGALDVFLFGGGEYYKIKIAVTARDLPKLEKEFFFHLSSEDNKYWYYNLIPVSDEVEKEVKTHKRLMILNQLGEYRRFLTARAKEINDMPSDTYHKSIEGGDNDSIGLIVDIGGFLRCTDGFGVNALADFESSQNMDRSEIHDLYGKTIYHDEWQHMQHLLLHREKNLAAIAKQFEAKPLD